ncbi:MAG: YihY/virulence factor BrkB family protein [Pseudomonadales bacterium]|nr:YihY/virulence factor BrkB family protein [Pseudomonadales bacterium]
MQQFIEHDCLARAGTLTYTTLFAIVPMMTVTYVVLSLFPEFSGVGQQIQTYLFQNFVPGSSALLYDKLAEFSDNSRNLTWISFGFLFVTAFMTLVTVEDFQPDMAGSQCPSGNASPAHVLGRADHDAGVDRRRCAHQRLFPRAAFRLAVRGLRPGCIDTGASAKAVERGRVYRVVLRRTEL